MFYAKKYYFVKNNSNLLLNVLFVDRFYKDYIFYYFE